jgi:hypothetical protein
MTLREGPGLLTVLSLLGIVVLIASLFQWWRLYGSTNIDRQFWAVQAASARRVANALLLPIAVDLFVRFGLELLASSLAQASELPFALIRVLLVLWSGWRVIVLGGGSPLRASLAGPVFLFVDLVVVKGLYVLVGAGQTSRERLLTMAGVLATFVVFVPLATFLAWLGAVAARWRAKRNVAVA